MGFPVNTYRAPQPANVVPQNAQMNSPLIIIIEDECQDSFVGGASSPVLSVSSQDNAPNNSGDNKIPTLAPEGSSKEATEEAPGKGCQRP